MYTSDGLRARTNLGGYANPELDGILSKAAVTQNQQESRALYAKAQQMISDAALSIPMYPATSRLAYNAKVHGLTVDHALGLPNFHEVWIAK
jgi:ABC-type transport system substrate-binding protein